MSPLPRGAGGGEGAAPKPAGGGGVGVAVHQAVLRGESRAPQHEGEALPGAMSQK